MTKVFKDLLTLSKGEHSLKEVIKLAGGEVYDAKTRYNKAEDGLREFDYDSGTYVDKRNEGVPTVATNATKNEIQD